MTKYCLCYFIFLLITSTNLFAGEVSEVLIHHQVFVWLNDDKNNNTVDEIIRETKYLKNIPGLVDLNVGKVISSDRKIVEDSYDIGIHMTFHSIEDMQRYLQHPEHQEFLRLHVKPFLKSIRVFDFSESLD